MIHLSISIETNYKMIKLGSLNIQTTSIIISMLEDPRETEKDTRINNNKQLASFKITRFPTINGNHKSNYSSSTTINHNKIELVTQMSSTISSIIKKDFSLKARPKINMHWIQKFSSSLGIIKEISIQLIIMIGTIKVNTNINTINLILEDGGNHDKILKISIMNMKKMNSTTNNNNDRFEVVTKTINKQESNSRTVWNLSNSRNLII
jgi:hypothetical protein